MGWTEIISIITAVVTVIVMILGSRLFRAIFWESLKYPNRKTEIEVQGSEIKIKAAH